MENLIKIGSKAVGVFIVLIGIGDIVFDKSYFWGAVIIAIGLSLLIKKWGEIMFKQWGKPQQNDAR